MSDRYRGKYADSLKFDQMQREFCLAGKERKGEILNDKELLTQCYHTMYQGMIEKDMELLGFTVSGIGGTAGRLCGISLKI